MMDSFKHNGQLENNQRYITKKQLAERLGVTEVSIDNWRRTGALPYIKMGASTNSRVLFDMNDVEDYMERRKLNVGERRHLQGLHRANGSFKPKHEDEADDSHVEDTANWDAPPDIY
jgi:predicted DNA-binding transcriptional regulator AlpA